MRSLKYEQAIRIFAPTETLDRIFFLNGTVNPATGQLTPFLKNDFSPTFINFPYPTEHVKCPRFDAFLDNISRGDPAIQMAIWQMVGYLLISKKKRRMGAETINGYDGILIQQ